MESEQKAARVMHEEYNETVTGWVHESIAATLEDLTNCVQKYHELNPQRFDDSADTQQPFVIADFGCATGASSIVPLRALITAVRKIAPKLTIQVYLEDLPENRFDIAF
jgi:SAM dependent carboxyl methyltransferase